MLRKNRNSVVRQVVIRGESGGMRWWMVSMEARDVRAELRENGFG